MALAVALAAGACGGEDSSDDVTSGAAVELPPPFQPAPDTRRPRRPTRMAAVVELPDGPGAFSHGPHRTVECASCHEDPAGHGSHALVECSACHARPDASDSSRAAGSEDCLECHHETVVRQAAEGGGCARCHRPDELPSRAVRTPLDVAGETPLREEPLPFSHGVHVGVECATCHSAPHTLGVERSCASCHEDHHRSEARCMTCHAGDPVQRHRPTAHRGCAGAGCHADPVVTSLPFTRQVCLSCHQDKEEHEPGAECAPCHRLPSEPVRPGAPSGEGGW